MLGRIINVPIPEAYTVHKMAINSQRGSKSTKDAQAILGIWPFLDEEKLGAVLAKLTKKERARAREFMDVHGLIN